MSRSIALALRHQNPCSLERALGVYWPVRALWLRFEACFYGPLRDPTDAAVGLGEQGDGAKERAGGSEKLTSVVVSLVAGIIRG